MIDAIIAALARRRLPLSDEKVLQAEIETALETAGIECEREVRLSASDVIDFCVGSIGIEVKIKGGKRAIYHQLERYSKHERLATLLLVTNVPMGMPPEINGKPVYVLNLAMAWL